MKTDKSVLKEAILEFNDLMEAAKEKAKDDMSKEFPEKFNKIMNEHIEKLNNMKNNINEKAETFKEEPKTEKAKEIGKTKDTDERKEGGDGVDDKVEKTFTKEPKTEGSKKVNESVEDDIDLTDFSMEELEEAFNDANDEDDFEIDEEIEVELDDDNEESEVDLDQIGDEISKMDEMSEEMDEDKDDPFTKLKKLQEEMSQIIDSINSSQEETGDDPMIQEFDEKMSGVYGENYKDVLGNEYDKMLELYKNQNTSKPDQFDGEDDIEVSMDDKEEMEESHGVSLSNNKKTGADTQPRPEYANYKKDKLRYALQREQFEKRIKSLVSENKKTKLEFKKLKNKVDESNNLLENYKSVIDKYRSRLNEMVVFNTNLSHVNNLLIDENFDFSFDDKKDIVDKFKPVQSIDESEKIYKEILDEKKNNKKDIVESIEKKYNNVVTPSSKQKIGEAVEKSAYKKDDHIDKIKGLMKYNEIR